MIVNQSLNLFIASIRRENRFAKSRSGLLIIVRYFSKAGKRLAEILPLA